ncbi:unnamed protein product [Didymodactylos carnosus]|uniref:Uncharacterized protein n=1 Tax=Didymodactylos carnosus TaxID=1234261 RepID=A0A813SHY6_9BILA|nr:unnamed protein product [Didymodactylos carnosus]CAF0796307.1 unnamed protein product [Didymodactylos carnosus]CAF3511140.1 unnamed protein product [Didymodactylos carnosus]CAF3580920.1 unnamed protein product [Didymodactylos carnosus]
MSNSNIKTPTKQKLFNDGIIDSSGTDVNDKLENFSDNPLDVSSGARHNEHAFFGDVSTIKELENDLTDLLQKFRAGTLLAFSPQFTCTKMDTIREQQEQLAKLHFSLDKDLSNINIESDECQKKANENMSCLMRKLQKLTEEMYPFSKEFKNIFLIFSCSRSID